ncbi:hypothetical protein [Dyadobacter sandarakinus]|uniref:Uncharacterized protein n=1 Tax=Dyadobacter sandarakinus TaxID=2747268 RepID=A0ABX7I7W1_9BACT|nr:hypothetical protein [Dyadobacter sandarakinus]QRR01263.1 hypothetical protein HWI92_10275 [Dyadobacter sandarakinus]
MNSSEQKDFENVSPTIDDIEATAAQLQKDYAEKSATRQEDAFEEGYHEALRILVHRVQQYTDISPALKSDAGKAVAVMAVNYLNGECSREALLAGAERLL